MVNVDLTRTTVLYNLDLTWIDLAVAVSQVKQVNQNHSRFTITISSRYRTACHWRTVRITNDHGAGQVSCRLQAKSDSVV